MQAIELTFPNDLDEAQVLLLLSGSDSGFEPDDRRALDSTVVDGFTIAGVVLNALSLATTIWALKIQLDQHAKANSTRPNPIRARRPSNAQRQPLPTVDIPSIVKALEDMTQSRK